ncbi:(d)CMP kinase [Desulfotalea psychrophila]|uniref:(d)CMP kinase n=1 Tax=Desulfotalea psychrophila TaxID=84980 RepID=UPI0002DBA062|nr:(d)CMP kinase [Desulfotalea psychrophila]
MSKSIDVVTIDGPAGVGKSTVSRRVAAELSYSYLDTGAMYRAVAIYLVDRGIDLNSEEDIASALKDIELELLPASETTDDTGVLVQGVDVSRRIRTPESGMLASRVSALAVVRNKLTMLQRELGERGRVVAEGRDMGTVVFPKAHYKFYLDADAEVRATRRYQQILARGEVADYPEILQQTIMRDSNDIKRVIAPLKQADDALLINTGVLTINEVADTVLEKIFF